MGYYITNGDQYVTQSSLTDITIGGPISQAKRFKEENAESVLSFVNKTHPEYCAQKFFSSKKHNDYVITTARNFVGNNNTIVNCISKARMFKTAADADGYIRSHGELYIKFANPIIINENKETVDIFGKRITSREKAKKIDVVRETNKTPRIEIPRDIKYEVYQKDNGTCQICGRPLTVENFTLDHIEPIGRGGANDISNYRCLCDRCNKWKGDSLDEELITMMSDVGTNYAYKHPYSDINTKLIRAMVRGRIYNRN